MRTASGTGLGRILVYEVKGAGLGKVLMIGSLGCGIAGEGAAICEPFSGAERLESDVASSLLLENSVLEEEVLEVELELEEEKLDSESEPESEVDSESDSLWGWTLAAIFSWKGKWLWRRQKSTPHWRHFRWSLTWRSL